MEALLAFDSAGAAWARGLRVPPLTPVMQAFTMLGERPVLFPLVAVVVVALLVLRKRLYAVTLTAAMFFGPLFVDVVKTAVGRPRPPASLALIETPASASFPSGHAFATLLFFGMLAWVVADSRREGPAFHIAAAVAVVTTLMVGASRVYLGVHWPTDVLASWALAVVWLGAGIALTLFVRARFVGAENDALDVREAGETVETPGTDAP